MLGAVGQGNIKHGRATGLVGESNTLADRIRFLIVVDIERVRCTVKINGLFAGLAVLCVPPGVIHPLGTRISLKPLVELLLAVFLHDLLHLAQLNGLVPLSVLFDIEGDLEVAGVLIVGNGIVQIFLGLLLRFHLGIGAFALSRGLALFLPLSRGLRLGGLLLAVSLALDMVLVVLSGAGQGLYSLGLPRTLDIGDGRLLAFSVGTLGALIFVFAFGLVENLILGLVSALGLVENLILGLLSALRGVVNYALGGGRRLVLRAVQSHSYHSKGALFRIHRKGSCILCSGPQRTKGAGKHR